MRALVVAAALTAMALAPSSAQAQGGLFAFAGEGRLVSMTQVPFRSSGSLAVRWSSDPATCAGTGRCGLDGVTTWTAPSAGVAVLFETEIAGRRERGGYLFFGGDDGGAVPLRARVRRATPDGSRVCVDAAHHAGFVALEEERGRVQIGLAHSPGPFGGGELLATRCAGPTAADVAAALPSLGVEYARLRRGRTTLRVGGEGSFAAGGLRGTAQSSLTLRLGRPRSGHDAPEAETGRVRLRELRVGLRVAEVRGDVAVDLAGAADPAECGPLDTCGLAGSLRLAPVATRGTVELYAMARASRGRRALRAALGLAPGGSFAGIEPLGFGEWEGPGRTEVAVARPGDGEPCADSGPLEDGALGLEFRGRTVHVTYQPSVPRSRCPGLFLPFPRGVASADVPLAAFGARRVEIALTQPASLLDQGWTATTRPALTVVLERTRVRERVSRGDGL